MRIRSQTKFRIILALAILGPIGWTVACSIPRSGGWPWPPGSPSADNWTLLDPAADHVVYNHFLGEKPKSDHRYMRNTRTGEVVKINDEGNDKWNVDADGKVEHTKSEATQLRESEARGAWVMRAFIYFAGLFLSFFAAYCAAWVGMFIVTRLIAREPGSQGNASRV